VNHYYTYDDARAASREATALRSMGRKPQVGRSPVRRVPKGRHCAGPMPPFQGSRPCAARVPGLAPWAMTCRPFRANGTAAATVLGIQTANVFEWNAAQQRTRKTDSGGAPLDGLRTCFVTATRACSG